MYIKGYLNNKRITIGGIRSLVYSNRTLEYTN